MATITAASGTVSLWQNTSSWVGGVVPTAADDVIINGSGPTEMDLTGGGTDYCRSLDCTGWTGILQSAGGTLNIGDSGGGSLKYSTGMTGSAGGIYNFVSTTTGNTITTNGNKLPDTITFNGVGGSWQFQDNVTANINLAMTLTNGTVDFNGKTFSIGSFSSNNSNTRTLTLGASSITLGSTTGLVWDCGTSTTGMTLTSNTATITLTPSTQTFAGGGLSNWHNIVFNPASGCQITGANTFANITLTGQATKTGVFTFSANQIVTGTFTCNGNSAINRLLVQSNTGGMPVIITTAATSISNADFEDITGAGSASWNLSAITGGSGDCGGNSGITFNTPKSCYMKTAVSVNWSGSNWYTASGGSTPISPAIPLPQDTAYFDSNSVTATSKTITLDMPRICGMNWSGIANTPTFACTTVVAIFGDVVFVSGMAISGTTQMNLSRGCSSFTTGGLSLTNPITVKEVSNTLVFADAVTSGQSLTLSSGTVSSVSTMSLNTLTIASVASLTLGGNITLIAAFSCTGTVSGTSYSISGGTTLAVPSGGSIVLGSFSGTTCSNGILGTATIGTLTLSGAFSMTSGSGSITIGSGGMTCTTFSCSSTGSQFTSGTGLVSCSSTATWAGGTITIGSGGFTATTITISSSTTRTINLGSGAITMTGTGTVWTATTTTGLTFNAQTSTVALTDTSATTKTLPLGALTYNNITISGAANNGTVTISGASTVATWTFGANCSIIWTKSTTYTFTGLVCNGTSGNLVTFATNTSGTPATLSCANVVNVDYMSVKDSTASNHIPFYAGTHSTNVSGNTSWSFTAAPSVAVSDALWFGMTF